MIQQIKTSKVPAAGGPYSQAVLSNGFAFLSGMLPLDVKDGNIVGETASEQTKQVMENISSLLSEVNLNFDDVVKTTIFLDSMESFQSVNEVYGSYFSSYKPARSCFEVSKLPRGALVEIEVIARMR